MILHPMLKVDHCFSRPALTNKAHHTANPFRSSGKKKTPKLNLFFLSHTNFWPKNDFIGEPFQLQLFDFCTYVSVVFISFFLEPLCTLGSLPITERKNGLDAPFFDWSSSAGCHYSHYALGWLLTACLPGFLFMRTFHFSRRSFFLPCSLKGLFSRRNKSPSAVHASNLADPSTFIQHIFNLAPPSFYLQLALRILLELRWFILRRGA